MSSKKVKLFLNVPLAEDAGISHHAAKDIYCHVEDTVSYWLDFADQVGVREEVSVEIESILKKNISS